MEVQSCSLNLSQTSWNDTKHQPIKMAINSRPLVAWLGWYWLGSGNFQSQLISTAYSCFELVWNYSIAHHGSLGFVSIIIIGILQTVQGEVTQSQFYYRAQIVKYYWTCLWKKWYLVESRNKTLVDDPIFWCQIFSLLLFCWELSTLIEKEDNSD